LETGLCFAADVRSDSNVQLKKVENLCFVEERKARRWQRPELGGFRASGFLLEFAALYHFSFAPMALYDDAVTRRIERLKSHLSSYSNQHITI
jgi:hypothetical protein